MDNIRNAEPLVDVPPLEKGEAKLIHNDKDNVQVRSDCQRYLAY